MFTYVVTKTNKIKSSFLKKLVIHALHRIVNFYLISNIFVILKIGKIKFKSPINHASVFWIHFHPTMNMNLSRLSSIVSKYKASSSFIDIGANIGDTWAILRSACPDNPILAIEGDPHPYNILEFNTLNDSLTTTFKGFIGDDKNYIFQGSCNGSSGLLINNNNSEKIPGLFSLDEVVKKTNFNNIGLIKVDTDGLDTIIVRTGSETLLKYKPIVFLEIQPYHLFRNDSFNDFLKFMIELNYKFFIIWDSNGRFLCDINMHDIKIISQLLPYFNGSPGNLFLDIAFLNKDDEHIKSIIVDGEVEYMKNIFTSNKQIPSEIIEKFYIS